MEIIESIYRNPILQEYFNPNQFHVTPSVRDPVGFTHSYVFDFEQKFLIKPMPLISIIG